jgi:transcription initiation factor IIF auxiliary subunit
MFLTLDHNPELTDKFVKCVTYFLHPCFKEKKIETYNHPFMLNRASFGRFVIGVEINFHSWTKLSPVHLDHPISL